MEKNMQENFDYLKKRVFETLELTDLKLIRNVLSQIDSTTICVGVGGSSVVSEYASKVLSKKNSVLSLNKEPRDLLYENLKFYKNVLVCSYSGNNYGVDVAFNNNLKKYILSSNKNETEDIISLNYSNNIPREKSFISLASTIIPMAILLNYYLDGDNERIKELICSYDFISKVDYSDNYEIMSGIDTSTASKFIESTMVESGIAIPVVHDKYSFCHGRSTTSYLRNNSLIYLNRHTSLDDLLLEESKKYYRSIVKLDGIYKDSIIDEFYLTIKALYLTKAIAEKKKMDLSKVKYSPIVKKLYKYNGAM